MAQHLKRVGPMSLAKTLAVLYAAAGLLVGCIIAAISMLAPSMWTGTGSGGMSMLFPMVGGLGALIVLPLLYALFGFIGGLIFGALYNFVAGLTGGIEVDLV